MRRAKSRSSTNSPPARSNSFERDAAALRDMFRHMDERFHVSDVDLDAERQLRLQQMEEEQMTLQRLCAAAALQQSGTHDGIVSTPRSLSSSRADETSGAVRSAHRRTLPNTFASSAFVPHVSLSRAVERPSRPLRPPTPPSAALYSPPRHAVVGQAETIEKSEAEDRRVLESFGATREEEAKDSGAVPHPYAPSRTNSVKMKRASERRELMGKMEKVTKGKTVRPLLLSASGSAAGGDTVAASHGSTSTQSLYVRHSQVKQGPSNVKQGQLHVKQGSSQDRFDVREDEQVLLRLLRHTTDSIRPASPSPPSTISPRPRHTHSSSSSSSPLASRAKTLSVPSLPPATMHATTRTLNAPLGNIKDSPERHRSCATPDAERRYSPKLSACQNGSGMLADENRTLHRELASQDGALRELTRKAETLARHLVRAMRERAELQDRVVAMDSKLHEVQTGNPKHSESDGVSEHRGETVASAEARIVSWRAAVEEKDRELHVCEDEIRRLRRIIELRVSRAGHTGTPSFTGTHNNGHSPLGDRDTEHLVLELAASRVRESEAEATTVRVADELLAAQAHIQQIDARLVEVERDAVAQQLREIRACAIPCESQAYTSRDYKNPRHTRAGETDERSTWPLAAQRELAQLVAEKESLISAHAESSRSAAQRYERVLRETSARTLRCEELTAELRAMTRRAHNADRWRKQLRDAREDAELVADVLRTTHDGAETALRALHTLFPLHHTLDSNATPAGEHPSRAQQSERMRERYAVVEAFLRTAGRDWDVITRFLSRIRAIDVKEEESNACRALHTQTCAASADTGTDGGTGCVRTCTCAELSEATRARRDFVLHAVNTALSHTQHGANKDATLPVPFSSSVVPSHIPPVSSSTPCLVSGTVSPRPVSLSRASLQEKCVRTAPLLRRVRPPPPPESPFDYGETPRTAEAYVVERDSCEEISAVSSVGEKRFMQERLSPRLVAEIGSPVLSSREELSVEQDEDVVVEKKEQEEEEAGGEGNKKPVVLRPHFTYPYHPEKEADAITGEAVSHSRRTGESTRAGTLDEKDQGSQKKTFSQREPHARIEAHVPYDSHLYKAQEFGSQPPAAMQLSARSSSDTRKATDSKSYFISESSSPSIDHVHDSKKEKNNTFGGGIQSAPLLEVTETMRSRDTHTVTPETIHTERHAPTNTAASSGESTKPMQKASAPVHSGAKQKVPAGDSPARLDRADSAPSQRSSSSKPSRQCFGDTPSPLSFVAVSPESTGEVSPLRADPFTLTQTTHTTPHNPNSPRSKTFSAVRRNDPASTPAAQFKSSTAGDRVESPMTDRSHSEPRLHATRPTHSSEASPPRDANPSVNTQSLSPLNARRQGHALEPKAAAAPVVREKPSHSAPRSGAGHISTSAPSLTEPETQREANAVSGAKDSLQLPRRRSSMAEMDLPSLHRPGMMNRPGE